MRKLASSRYVIRRWNVPILAVDCNANPRHKQASSPALPFWIAGPRHTSPGPLR